MRYAACVGADPNLFFPDRGQHDQVNEAKVICMDCVVRPECKEYRTRTKSDHGVWGGVLHARKDSKKRHET